MTAGCTQRELRYRDSAAREAPAVFARVGSDGARCERWRRLGVCRGSLRGGRGSGNGRGIAGEESCDEVGEAREEEHARYMVEQAEKHKRAVRLPMRVMEERRAKVTEMWQEGCGVSAVMQTGTAFRVRRRDSLFLLRTTEPRLRLLVGNVAETVKEERHDEAAGATARNKLHSCLSLPFLVLLVLLEERQYLVRQF